MMVKEFDCLPSNKSKRWTFIICYIASAETKRDCVIHGHVALDKRNVSLGQ